MIRYPIFTHKTNLYLAFCYLQVFAILFFIMMVVLGIGSSVAFLSTINTVFLDAFAQIHIINITMINCTLGFLSGIVYLTPVSISVQIYSTLIIF